MMKIMIAMVCAMAACAVEPTVQTSTTEQGVICDPNCDPANMQYVLAAYINAGQSVGTQVTNPYCRVVRGYGEAGDIEQWNECTGLYRNGSGQTYLVDCADRLGSAICGTLACGEAGQQYCP